MCQHMRDTEHAGPRPCKPRNASRACPGTSQANTSLPQWLAKLSSVGGEATNAEPCPSCSAAACDSVQQEAAGAQGLDRPAAPRQAHTRPLPSQPPCMSADENPGEMKFMVIHPHVWRCITGTQRHRCCSSSLSPSLPCYVSALGLNRYNNQCSHLMSLSCSCLGASPLSPSLFQTSYHHQLLLPGSRGDSEDPALPCSSAAARPCSIQPGGAPRHRQRGKKGLENGDFCEGRVTWQGW